MELQGPEQCKDVLLRSAETHGFYKRTLQGIVEALQDQTETGLQQLFCRSSCILEGFPSAIPLGRLLRVVGTGKPLISVSESNKSTILTH